jgi:phage portal protein BeeE
MNKPRESKMLDNVRRWRKKAYEADKAKSLSKRIKEEKDIALKFNLPHVKNHNIDLTNKP